MIQFLTSWNGHEFGSTASLGGAEAGLIAARIARAWTPGIEPFTDRVAKLRYDADGALVGIVTADPVTGVETIASLGGGASAWSSLSDKASANLPVDNTPLATALGLKALAASPVFTGPVTSPGAAIVVGAAMGALSIDVTKESNTKSISVDSTFTFSATPAADTWFGLALTNTDTVAHVATIPSSRPEASSVAITTVNVPALATIYLTWRYTGSAYQVFGSGVPPGVAVRQVSAALTTVAGDANSILSHAAADTTARAWVIDSNANVPFEVGTYITFDNEFGAGALTVSIASDTLEWAPTGGTGTRTIASGGQMTIVKKTSTKWRASGVGIT